MTEGIERRHYLCGMAETVAGDGTPDQRHAESDSVSHEAGRMKPIDLTLTPLLLSSFRTLRPRARTVRFAGRDVVEQL